MPTKVQHDRGNDRLHLIFNEDRLIVEREWCAPNAVIALAVDGEPLQITIYDYYTNPHWQFTPEFVEQYKLESYLEDLRLVHDAFFSPPNYSVKYISYEGPDGNEVIVRPGAGDV